MATKRNTKMVLASLLATSAIVPAVAASAEVGGETTRALDAVTTSLEATPVSAEEGEQVSLGTISFKIEDPSGFIGRHLGTEGELVELNGQQYILITLPAAAGNFVNSVTVDGQEILVKEDEVYLAVPVTEDFAPVTAVVSALGQVLEVTLTPGEVVEGDTDEETDTDTGEEPTTPEEPAEPVAPAPLKYLAYEAIPDGEYEVTFDAYNPKTGEGNYTAITRQLDAAATLVVEDGKYFLDVSETARPTEDGGNESWITEYQVEINGEYVTAETVAGELGQYPHVVRLPLTSLNELTTAKLHVVAPQYNMDTWYDFKFAIDKGQNLPQLLPTYVYKDGTNELSIMQETYLSTTSTAVVNEDGTYSVDITFPQGQYIVGDLIFNDESYTVADSYEDGKNTVKIYTVEVEDLSQIYTATFDLDVQGFYKTQHTAQIQFGGEQNPFADITKSYAYSNVVSLYNKGIFKAADAFNPANNLQRGHFALMLARAFDLEVPATTPFTDLRTDVEEQNAIKALNAYGVINGVTATTFAPEAAIQRYQAALMIDRILNKYDLTVENNGASFTDIATQMPEAQTAITKLANLGIINGVGDGKFDPTGTLTREQMAKILDKALKIIEKQ